MRQQREPVRTSVETRLGRIALPVWTIRPTKRLHVVASPRRVEIGTPREVALLEEGTVLFPRRNEGTRQVMHHIYLEGLFDAIRGRSLVMLGYGARNTGGEQGELRVLGSSITELLGLIANYGKLAEAERRQASESFSGLAAHLERVRNPAKRAAREKLAAGASLRDRLGRPNVSASAARAVGARNRLTMRADEIREIAPWVGYYELALVAERDRIYGILEDLEALLRNLVGPGGILHGEPRTYLRSRQGIMVRLGHAVSQLRTITVEPFIWSRYLLTAELAEAAHLLGRVGNTPSVREFLDRSLRSLVFRFVQRQVEEMRVELSCAIESDRRITKTFNQLAERTVSLSQLIGAADDSGFRAPPRHRLLAVLTASVAALLADKGEEAKKCLAEAARLFSRP